MEKREELLPIEDLKVQVENVLKDRALNKPDLSVEELYHMLRVSLAQQINLEEQNDELQQLIENREQGFLAVAHFTI